MYDKLEKTIKSWYETTDECNIIAAMEIGYKILNSSTYIDNKDTIMDSLNKELEKSHLKIKSLAEENRRKVEERELEFDSKLRLEKAKHEELKKDNTHSINIAIENGLKSVERERNTLKDFKEQLPILYEKYSDILDNYIDGDKKNSKITNDEFCILVELIGRLHVDSMKIQYNYDEYMLQTYDF